MFKSYRKYLYLFLVVLLVFSISCKMDSPNDQEKDPLFRQIEKTNNWRVFKPSISRSLEEITTYNSVGLVADHLEVVLSNGKIVAVGNLEMGISVIDVKDLDNPRGKVRNYLGRGASPGSAKLGASDFAIDPTNNKMYAWYGKDIVDLQTFEVKYDNAPDFTRSYHGTSPHRRFEIDSQGNFWIGSSELYEDGAEAPYGGTNGLYKITKNGSSYSKTKILSHAVWYLYRFSHEDTEVIVASTNDGIYFIDANGEGQKLNLKIEGSENEWYLEQIIEHNNDIFLVVKNFFHVVKSQANDPDKFKLLKLNNLNGSESIEFEVLTTNFGEEMKIPELTQIRAFVYNEEIYFVRIGTLFKLNFNEGKIEETSLGGIGQYSHSVVGGTLYSVGNFGGLAIREDGKNRIITQASTTEGLISDNISTIYTSIDQKNVYIGSALGGAISQFNVTNKDIKNYNFERNVSVSSIFEYDGNVYVLGSGSLGIVKDTEIERVTSFYTNSEISAFDPKGYLWAHPTFGSNNSGLIAMMELESYKIKRTKDYRGTDHYANNGEGNSKDDPLWDEMMHYFKHVHPIPNSNEAMISLAELDAHIGVRKINFTYKYSYDDDKFSKVPIDDPDSMGIVRMATSNEGTLYGAAPNKMFVFDGEKWVDKYKLQLSGGITDMVIIDNKYAVIGAASYQTGATTYSGFEILNLSTGDTKYFNSYTTPLPFDMVTALSVQKLSSTKFRIWFGTRNGVAYCEVTM